MSTQNISAHYRGPYLTVSVTELPKTKRKEKQKCDFGSNIEKNVC
jgi:hypothetical protein